MTALMRAAGGKPSPAIVDLLLGHGASVNSKDINGRMLNGQDYHIH